jgi:hypothetical protein
VGGQFFFLQAIFLHDDLWRADWKRDSGDGRWVLGVVVGNWLLGRQSQNQAQVPRL